MTNSFKERYESMITEDGRRFNEARENRYTEKSEIEPTIARDYIVFSACAYAHYIYARFLEMGEIEEHEILYIKGAFGIDDINDFPIIQEGQTFDDYLVEMNDLANVRYLVEEEIRDALGELTSEFKVENVDSIISDSGGNPLHISRVIDNIIYLYKGLAERDGFDSDANNRRVKLLYARATLQGLE